MRGSDRPAGGTEEGTGAGTLDGPAPHRRAGTGRNLVHAADHNLRITLEAVRRSGSLSRPDLARVTGLSEVGVGNILRQLVGSGLVRQAGRAGRAAGFELAEDGAFGLGLDLDEGGATAVLVDLRGRVRLRRRGGAGSIGSLTDAVTACLGRHADRLAGCGISLAAGVATAEATPWQEALQAHAPALMRDTTAAVLGELHFGRPERGSFVHLVIGRSIRAGIVIDGRPFRGMHGQAGQLGRLRAGRDGMLDEVAGVETMPGYPFGDEAGALPPEPGLAAWLDRAAPPLMDAVVAISGFLGPAAVLVGGRLPDPVLRAIAERLSLERERRVGQPHQPRWLPPIAPASLGCEAAAMGAAVSAFFDRLLPDPRR